MRGGMVVTSSPSNSISQSPGPYGHGISAASGNHIQQDREQEQGVVDLFVVGVIFKTKNRLASSS